MVNSNQQRPEDVHRDEIKGETRLKKLKVFLSLLNRLYVWDERTEILYSRLCVVRHVSPVNNTPNCIVHIYRTLVNGNILVVKKCSILGEIQRGIFSAMMEHLSK